MKIYQSLHRLHLLYLVSQILCSCFRYLRCFCICCRFFTFILWHWDIFCLFSTPGLHSKQHTFLTALRDRIRFHAFDCTDGIGKSAASAGNKRDDCLTGHIVIVQKAVQDHRHISPPVRELKCSLPLEPFENTGFNAIQKCVLCSFYPISNSVAAHFQTIPFYYSPYFFSNTCTT